MSSELATAAHAPTYDDLKNFREHIRGCFSNRFGMHYYHMNTWLVMRFIMDYGSFDSPTVIRVCRNLTSEEKDVLCLFIFDHQYAMHAQWMDRTRSLFRL